MHKLILRRYSCALASGIWLFWSTAAIMAQQTAAPDFRSQAQDPGPRAGQPGAGGALSGLTSAELAAFTSGQAAFQEVDGVSEGLGPRFNGDSCAGCHAAPAVGGSSPLTNPQLAMATRNGARNTIPAFLSQNGAVREVRFKNNPDGTPDGGVHALFVITGRADAPRGCSIQQPDFSNQSNLSFRIPTPVFGGGLIESIRDSTILANLGSNQFSKSIFQIRGRVNRNGNDGTITRFGWKGQNKSLTIFAGEAYNVEQGVTNEVFPNEREESSSCASLGTPEDHTTFGGSSSDVLEFMAFMKFSAAPAVGPSSSSIQNGAALFSGQLGCNLCHTPTLTTGSSTSSALSNKSVNLYSDLALHHMGSGLSDGISQGVAGPDEFRTAPLWGLGQRVYFLHDGRTSDLIRAIQAHASSGSEATVSAGRFSSLSSSQMQDVLNFLRSL